MTSHFCGNTKNKVVLLLLLLLFSLWVSLILELESLLISFAASDSTSALSVIPGVNFNADGRVSKKEEMAKGIGGGEGRLFEGDD